MQKDGKDGKDVPPRVTHMTSGDSQKANELFRLLRPRDFNNLELLSKQNRWIRWIAPKVFRALLHPLLTYIINLLTGSYGQTLQMSPVMRSFVQVRVVEMAPPSRRRGSRWVEPHESEKAKHNVLKRRCHGQGHGYIQQFQQNAKEAIETFSTVQHKQLNCQRYVVWQGQIHIGKDRSSMRLSCTVLQDFPWQPARRSTERCSRRGALYFRKSDVKCNRSQFLNTFWESCPRFLMVSPVPRQCRKWLERCEAHQQWAETRQRPMIYSAGIKLLQKMPPSQRPSESALAMCNFKSQTCRIWLAVVCPNWSKLIKSNNVTRSTSWSYVSQCCLVYSGWLMEGVPWVVLENLISKDSLALNGQKMSKAVRPGMNLCHVPVQWHVWICLMSERFSNFFMATRCNKLCNKFQQNMSRFVCCGGDRVLLRTKPREKLDEALALKVRSGCTAQYDFKRLKKWSDQIKRFKYILIWFKLRVIWCQDLFFSPSGADVFKSIVLLCQICVFMGKASQTDKYTDIHCYIII